MYCRNCGKELADNSLYCNNCGASQTNDKLIDDNKETKVWGILSIIFALVPGFLVFGLVFAIVGLCTYQQKENKILCWVGIGLFIVMLIIYIVLLLFVIYMGTIAFFEALWGQTTIKFFIIFHLIIES